jgi:uncharacterized protein (DUF1501 family)
MKRRSFLAAGATITLPVFLNGMRIGAHAKPSLFSGMAPGNDKVMVLIQLAGGNDGLGMVLPLDQYSNLSKVRSNILIPETKALKLTDNLGIHPAMTGMQKLFTDGKLTVVHSAGYPNQNRSHFRSTDIWSSGSGANEYLNTGWMGRYFQTNYPEYPDTYPNKTYPDPFAITIGSTESETCQGTIVNFSLTLTDPFSLSLLNQGGSTADMNTLYGKELDYLRTSISQSNSYSKVITAAANKAKNLATYPQTTIAGQLKNVALMIAGGLKTNVYVVRIGGFDTHANQVDPTDTTVGQQATILKQISEAVAAFQEDLRLQKMEERVIGMTFSEFGRQIASNNSRGTDHGTAAPLFLFGSCVNQQIVGKNPTIADKLQSQEGVAMQTDFRDIYGSILVDWFGVSTDKVKTLLYNNFTKLPILKNCALATDVDETIIEATGLNIYPNPFRDTATLQFRTAEAAYIRVSLFDTLGSELQVITSQNMPAGDHQFQLDGSNLDAGYYFCRIQSGSGVHTLRIVKL